MDFEQFKHSHSAQLQRIPEIYWEALYEKLCGEVYDAGRYFTMSPSEGEDQWRVLLSCENGLTKDDPSHVFLIDHAWTFQPPHARHLLRTVSGLANRMAALMNIIKLPTMKAEDSDSYDADSESGDEGGSSRCSDDDLPQTDQSDHSIDPPPPPADTAEDGYSSGDLGDVSHAYTTEHAQHSDQSDTGSSTPTRPFAERYKIASLEQKVNQLSVDGGCGIEGAESLVDGGCGTEGAGSALEAPSDELVEKIVQRMWSYCHAYHINNSPLPVWYIMDEFGSRIQQSCDPSVAMVVFFYIPTQLAFTAMWPLRDLHYSDEVTCNFVPDCVKSGLEYECHALPWSCDSGLTLDSSLWSELNKFVTPTPTERCNEDALAHPPPPPLVKSVYRVYTDIKVVQSHLTVPEFKVCGGVGDADILWLAEHFKEYKSLKPHQFVNQFPHESMITCKDLLVVVARRASDPGSSLPPWLPLTFNLLYELPQLVRCFKEREKQGETNVWIVKPWNLGRGLGITVTDNLMEIIRLAQVGPKIASRYLANPVLFCRDDVGWVKFDIRYIVMLKSVSPIELYVYNVFWLRFANKPFSLKDFCDYDKHFTVMNYTQGGSKLKQIHDVDFIPMFESMYPKTSWRDQQAKIYDVIRAVFRAAVADQPPAALGHCNQSRAIYGLDFMLEWSEGTERTMEPLLLEINYCPDCIRACKYHPQFFNHIFQTLFDVEGANFDPPITRLL